MGAVMVLQAVWIQCDPGICSHYNKGGTLSTAVIIIILALIVGGVGLAVEALRWLLIIALVLLVVGALTGRKRVA